MARNGRRLIEDYLPIEAVSKEASREKSVRKGHISTLHLWWARRPLVACRAAIYAALVPAALYQGQAQATVYSPADAELSAEEREETERSLARSFGRGKAGDFIARLCTYPGDPATIKEAERHILAAHAEKLSAEKGEQVTVEQILKGEAPRPRVLDMFAGGGSIPLEALRLGCEAYALDLNPVAHIVQLCTLVYPQKYGKPDKKAKGSAPDGTWAGLAKEVEHWGQWVLEQVRAEVGDLYPPIPDPDFKGKREPAARDLFGNLSGENPTGYLTPLAYLWTRTVRCKNPGCGATVPLVRQTWLCKKKNRCVALKMIAPKGAKQVRFEVVDSPSEGDLGFDPSAFSKGGNVACPFCGVVCGVEDIKLAGRAAALGKQLIAIVATPSSGRGWRYLPVDEHLAATIVPEGRLKANLDRLAGKGMSPPDESIAGLSAYVNSLGVRVRSYGITRFQDLFTTRQLVFHLSVAQAIRQAGKEAQHYSDSTRKALLTLLGCALDRGLDFGCSLCV